MRRRALRDELVAPLDRVLVAEARAADVDAARPDPEAVVEVGRAVVADVHRRRQRLDPLRLDRQIAARVLREVRDARDLEPDDERGVVCDPLRVRLGEADEDLGREVEALHPTPPYDPRMTPGDLAELNRDRQPCVVLTGAGVSTESGIPDFRSAGGIWASYDPMEVASIAGFRRDPERVWEFYARRLAVLADAEPNDAHRALAPPRGAGSRGGDRDPERRRPPPACRLRGRARGARLDPGRDCLGCGAPAGLDRLQELLPLPRCECGEVLKPGVVMFGELLPEYAIERATALARRARLLLVVGSSLEVHPVAGLPLETLAAGGSLAIVNRGPTALDGRAHLLLDEARARFCAKPCGRSTRRPSYTRRMQGSADDRLATLETLMRQVLDRLEQLEGRPAPPQPPVPPRPEAAPPPPPGRCRRPRPPPSRPGATVSLEDLLGGRVLAWVGGAAVVLGVVFFLVMAANRGWIDETTRVLLAFIGSTALLGVGLYLHEQQGRTQAALAAVAAAIAALYVTLTAATGLYDLIDPALALVFAGLVGAVATAIAVRWDEPVVAGLGIVGALLAPVFVEAGTDSTALAFMTIALVSAVGVLLWRRWSWLGSRPSSSARLSSGSGSSGSTGTASGSPSASWPVSGCSTSSLRSAMSFASRRPTCASSRRASCSRTPRSWPAPAGRCSRHGPHDAATAWVIGAAAVHIGGGIPAYGGRMSKEIAALIMAVGTALAALGLALAIDGPASSPPGRRRRSCSRGRAQIRRSAGPVRRRRFFALALAHTVAIEAPPDALRYGLDEFGSAAIAVVVVGVTAAALSRLSGAARAAYRVHGHRGDGGSLSPLTRDRLGFRGGRARARPDPTGAPVRVLAVGGPGPGSSSA